MAGPSVRRPDSADIRSFTPPKATKPKTTVKSTAGPKVKPGGTDTRSFTPPKSKNTTPPQHAGARMPSPSSGPKPSAATSVRRQMPSDWPHLTLPYQTQKPVVGQAIIDVLGLGKKGPAPYSGPKAAPGERDYGKASAPKASAPKASAPKAKASANPEARTPSGITSASDPALSLVGGTSKPVNANGTAMTPAQIAAQKAADKAKATPAAKSNDPYHGQTYEQAKAGIKARSIKKYGSAKVATEANMKATYVRTKARAAAKAKAKTKTTG